jgi:TolB protein
VFRGALQEDLKRSGWFAIAARGKALVSVSGRCVEAGGALTADIAADNPTASVRYLVRTYTQTVEQAAALAHRVADDLVLAVKQVPGIASTRIAMVGSRRGRKNLYVCGPQGGDLVQITQDDAICLSPSWSPDGASLLYTSLHAGFPDVYLVNLLTRRRMRLAAFPGLNAGAEFSPDGERVALILSKDGNPELYLLAVADRSLKRVTRTRTAAEASPSWSPDGTRIAFVSDRSGSRQMYLADLRAGTERQISFRSSENHSPDWGPDGRIAYCSRRDGRFQICVLDPVTRREERITTDGADYEEPSWARDGRHLACTRTESHHSDVYILDTLGDPPIRLTAWPGDWYSPDWSAQ